MQPVDSALGMARQKSGERTFCAFSQQLNNPHARWIDRLPREQEGGDGETGRKGGGVRAGLRGVFFVASFVCAWGVSASSLGPGWRPPLS